jgi:N-acetylglucosamine-6-phosphate deacetylase
MKLSRIESFRKNDPILTETITGYHIEGPYLSALPGFRGAHNANYMHAPDLKEFDRLQSAANDNIRLITLAPELAGSEAFIREVVKQGVVVSLGHTDASESEIDQAIEAGATLCTHLGNGVPLQLHRHENVIHRLLARDELTACLIPDGIHLPPSVLKNYYKAKPAGKVIFTTDCMAAAGAPPGNYTLGELKLSVGNDRVVHVPGQKNFAGSSLLPEEVLTNTQNWLHLKAESARKLYSTQIAELFGITLPTIHL